MKRLIVLMAVLLVAGSAFAGVGRPISVAPNATFNNGLLPTSTNNDDTCDIASSAPAATLLLPYFEVDFKSPQTTARTTLFTIADPGLSACSERREPQHHEPGRLRQSSGRLLVRAADRPPAHLHHR